MPSANSNGVLLCKNNQDEITSFLRQHEAYILAQARKLVPRNVFSPEIIDLETDELVQKSRIKLWQVLQERAITNPRAYIKAVVRSEAINATRQHGLLPLPVDADGELHQEGIIGRSGEDTQDPAVIFEQKEQIAEQTARAVNDILDLPLKQRQAMICALKEDVDDAQLLAQVFKLHGVNIESIHWPWDKAAASKSKALLVCARRKLCRLMTHRRARQDMDTKPVEHIQQSTSGSVSALQQPETSSYHSKEAPSLEQSKRKPSVKAEDSGNAVEIEGAEVNKLREPYRTAVYLHYVQKRSYPQMAAELNLPEGTVKSLVCRGMKMLQKYREQGDVEQGLVGEPGREMESAEDIADMAAQIEHVTEPYRTALHLHCVRNLSYPQMAAELNLPEGTVKSQISRGKKILRAQSMQAS